MKQMQVQRKRTKRAEYQDDDMSDAVERTLRASLSPGSAHLVARAVQTLRNIESEVTYT